MRHTEQINNKRDLPTNVYSLVIKFFHSLWAGLFLFSSGTFAIKTHNSKIISQDRLDQSQDYFGPKEKCFGLAADWFEAKEERFETKEEWFGAKEECFEPKEEWFGAKEDWFEAKEEPFEAKEEWFGAKEEWFGAREVRFGAKKIWYKAVCYRNTA